MLGSLRALRQQLGLLPASREHSRRTSQYDTICGRHTQESMLSKSKLARSGRLLSVRLWVAQMQAR